jgi:hypothetical protein
MALPLSHVTAPAMPLIPMATFTVAIPRHGQRSGPVRLTLMGVSRVFRASRPRIVLLQIPTDMCGIPRMRLRLLPGCLHKLIAAVTLLSRYPAATQRIARLLMPAITFGRPLTGGAVSSHHRVTTHCPLVLKEAPRQSHVGRWTGAWPQQVKVIRLTQTMTPLGERRAVHTSSHPTKGTSEGPGGKND